MDIGAHTGEWLEHFRKFCAYGRHVAIEPVPAMARKLKAHYPEIEVVDVAVSDEDGEATFFIPRGHPAWSGLRPQSDVGASGFFKETVRVQRLDGVLSREKGRFSFVKIDVEGAEFSVLNGGLAFLRRDRPVLFFEHALVHSREYDVLPDRLGRLLIETLEYDLYILGEPDPLPLAEFVTVCISSYVRDYDEWSHTNFLAVPREQEAPVDIWHSAGPRSVVLE